MIWIVSLDDEDYHPNILLADLDFCYFEIISSIESLLQFDTALVAAPCFGPSCSVARVLLYSLGYHFHGENRLSDSLNKWKQKPSLGISYKMY